MALYVVRSEFWKRPIVKVFTDESSLLDYIKATDVYRPGGPLANQSNFLQDLVWYGDFLNDEDDPDAFFAWTDDGNNPSHYAEYPDDEYEATLMVQRVALEPVTQPIAQSGYRGDVFDVIYYGDRPIAEFLEEDKYNNIVVIVNETSAYGLNKQMLLETPDSYSLRYKCHRQGGLFIRPTDVDFANPYMKLDIPYSILVPKEDAMRMLYSSHRIWSLQSYVPKQTIEPMASHGILTNDGILNLDAEPLNVIGTSHCQPGNGLELMKLFPTSLLLGGRSRGSKLRSTKRSRSRRKSRSRSRRHSRRHSKRLNRK
jgi:hypothetical protein